MSTPTQNPNSFPLESLLRIVNWLVDNEVVVPFLLCIGLLAVYLAFPTRNYYWDGIVFAQTIEDADHLSTALIHPNHLIYNVLGYFFYHLLLAVGLGVRAITALQVLNSIFGSIAAIVLFVTLKAMLRSLYLATFLTLLFGLSATWWKFSTDADAYIPSVLFLLWSFYFIMPGRRSRPFLVALLFSVSMSLHQLAIFFGPVIVLGLVFQETRDDSRKAASSVIRFGLLSFVITSVAYLFCFYLATHNFHPVTFIRWITSYSPDAPLSFNFWDLLRYTLRGQVRLFFTGRFNLLKGLINPVIIILTALLAIAVCAFSYFVVKNFKKPQRKSLRALMSNARTRPLLYMSMIWIAVYIAFLFFWLPQHTFYRLFYLPPAILLLGLFAAARYDFAVYRPTYRLALFTVVVGLANFLFSIYPYSYAEKVPQTRFALELANQWAAGTVIFYDLENSDKSLVRYFTPSTNWMQLKSSNLKLLDDQLTEIYAQGSTAWLETTTIDRLASTPEGAQWLAAHAKRDSHRELKDKGLRIEFLQVVP